MRDDEGALARRPRHSVQHPDGSNRSGRDAPALIVVFELESAPYVYASWNTDEDDRRLAAWFESRPGYAELVSRAVELSRRAA